MARLSRLVLPGLHHVTQRGNRRMKTFFEDGDYELYRDLLAGAAKARESGDLVLLGGAGLSARTGASNATAPSTLRRAAIPAFTHQRLRTEDGSLRRA
jgi:hypothetical protein